MKHDFKKELAYLYKPKAGKQETVTVPPMKFLMIDGKGDPNTSQEYMDAIQTLYPVAYTIKFICKREMGQDFSVMPLEGLWWADNMNAFTDGKKDEWRWTAMIMQPDIVTQEIYERARDEVASKKAPKSLSKLRFETYDEGRAVQTLFIGPYAKEGPAIQELHERIKDQGGTLKASTKHHHEIYMSDPRRVAPERLRTIIRQPY